MGSSRVVQEFIVNTDGSAVFLARIYGADGTFTQAQFGTITRSITDTRTGQVVTASITVATSVYDTLQTNAIQWPYSTGYNFRDVIPASAFPNERRYEVRYTFNATGAEQFKSRPVGANAD